MNSILTHRQQGLFVAGFGAAALGLAILIVAGSKGLSQPEPVRAHFVPNKEQLRSFAVQSVEFHVFRNEIVTDGYVAADAGGAKGAGFPVLQTQAADMLQIENDLSAAQVQYRNAAAAEDRQHKLYLSQGAALKDWQQSQADLAVATLALATAKNKLRLLGKGDEGNGRTFTVGNGSSVWLIANVREGDAGLVHVGDVLSASLPALSGSALHGRISFISSVIDATTHRLVVGARVANPGAMLKPNMLATVDILGNDAKLMPAVPQNAIIYEGQQAHVWVIAGDRHLLQRAVKTGRTSNGLIEITAGLQRGEKIATEGGLFIDQAGTGD